MAIGKVRASFSRATRDDNGDMELTFRIAKDSQYNANLIVKDIKKLNADLVLSVDKFRNRRSIEQNRLLWSLLEIMATEMNGGRTGDITAWDCYINMLEKFGAKYDYFLCLPEAVEAFKLNFRAVKEIEKRDYNGKEMVVCKCFYGSSKFDTKEMTQLIDGIFDILAEMGVDAQQDVSMLYEQWRAL